VSEHVLSYVVPYNKTGVVGSARKATWTRSTHVRNPN